MSTSAPLKTPRFHFSFEVSAWGQITKANRARIKRSWYLGAAPILGQFQSFSALTSRKRHCLLPFHGFLLGMNLRGLAKFENCNGLRKSCNALKKFCDALQMDCKILATHCKCVRTRCKTFAMRCKWVQTCLNALQKVCNAL